MKKLTYILIALSFICSFFVFCGKNVFAETYLRNYKTIKLAKGSFLKAISLRDISSSTTKVSDIHYFINPADVFIGESNVIPQNSVYLGEVEEIIEAVEGVNAAMKIKIYKVITPDKDEYTLDANLFRNGSIILGGDLAEVAYYTRMPHYAGTWKNGVLQYVPTSIREMGRPVFIKAGDEVTIIINSDQSLYKPVE